MHSELQINVSDISIDCAICENWQKIITCFVLVSILMTYLASTWLLHSISNKLYSLWLKLIFAFACTSQTDVSSWSDLCNCTFRHEMTF